jgi:hypothetical protein
MPMAVFLLLLSGLVISHSVTFSQDLDTCRRFEKVFAIEHLQEYDLPIEPDNRYSIVSVKNDTIFALAGYSADSGYMVLSIPWYAETGPGVATYLWLPGEEHSEQPDDFLVTDSYLVLFFSDGLRIYSRARLRMDPMFVYVTGFFGAAWSENHNEIHFVRRENPLESEFTIPEERLPRSYFVKLTPPFDEYEQAELDLGLNGALISRGPRNFCAAVHGGTLIANALEGAVAYVSHSREIKTTQRIYSSLIGQQDSLLIGRAVNTFLPRKMSNFITVVHDLESRVRTIQRMELINDTSGVVVWNDTGFVRSGLPLGMDSAKRYGLTFFRLRRDGHIIVKETFASTRADDGSEIRSQLVVTGREKPLSDGSWVSAEHIPVSVSLTDRYPDIERKLRIAVKERNTIVVMVRQTPFTNHLPPRRR